MKSHANKGYRRFAEGGLVEYMKKALSGEGLRKGSIYESVDPGFSEKSRQIAESQMRAKKQKAEEEN